MGRVALLFLFSLLLCINGKLVHVWPLDKLKNDAFVDVVRGAQGSTTGSLSFVPNSPCANGVQVDNGSASFPGTFMNTSGSLVSFWLFIPDSFENGKRHTIMCQRAYSLACDTFMGSPFQEYWELIGSYPFSLSLVLSKRSSVKIDAVFDESIFNQWNHWAFGNNGTNTVLYRNGKMAAFGNSFDLEITSPANISIGNYTCSNSTGQAFIFDELQIYDNFENPDDIFHNPCINSPPIPIFTGVTNDNRNFNVSVHSFYYKFINHSRISPIFTLNYINNNTNYTANVNYRSFQNLQPFVNHSFILYTQQWPFANETLVSNPRTIPLKGTLKHVFSFTTNRLQETMGHLNASVAKTPAQYIFSACMNAVSITDKRNSMTINGPFKLNQDGDFTFSFVLSLSITENATYDIVKQRQLCKSENYWTLQYNAKTENFIFKLVGEGYGNIAFFESFYSKSNLIGYKSFTISKNENAVSLFVGTTKVGSAPVLFDTAFSSPFQFSHSGCLEEQNTTAFSQIRIDEVLLFDTFVNPYGLANTCFEHVEPPQVEERGNMIHVYENESFYNQFNIFKAKNSLFIRVNDGPETNITCDFTCTIAPLSYPNKYTLWFTKVTSWGTFYSAIINYQSPSIITTTTSKISTSTTSQITTTTSTSTSTTTTSSSTPLPIVGLIDCEMNNGGCDFRVSCSPTGGCGACPEGTYTNGSICYMLCGDGNCSSSVGENCVTCPRDCGYDPCGVCGDGVCDATESPATCSEDCRAPLEEKCNLIECHHGECKEGICICEREWTGPKCDLLSEGHVGNITTYIKDNKITIKDDKYGNEFFISINSIYEIEDDTKNVVRNISISDLNFKMTEEYLGLNVKYNYSARFYNNKAGLSIIIWKFHEPQVITFAQTTTLFQPNTIKVNVYFQNWPFANLHNSLLLKMEAEAIYTKEYSCPPLPDSNGEELRWVKVTLNQTSLYAQFLDKIYVDGRIRTIPYRMESDTEVVATIPHFWDDAEMDPHYSVLIGGYNNKPGNNNNNDINNNCDYNNNNNNNKSSTPKLLPVYIAVPVGTTVLVALFILVYPKLHKWYKVRTSIEELPETETEMQSI